MIECSEGTLHAHYSQNNSLKYRYAHLTHLFFFGNPPTYLVSLYLLRSSKTLHNSIGILLLELAWFVYAVCCNRDQTTSVSVFGFQHLMRCSQCLFRAFFSNKWNSSHRVTRTPMTAQLRTVKTLSMAECCTVHTARVD